MFRLQPVDSKPLGAREIADDLVLYVDHLITSPTLEPVNDVNVTMPPTQIWEKQNVVSSYQVGSSKKINEDGSEFVECRIFQEEDIDKSMEIPCACTGSMKYAHRKCVQRWCNEKGDPVYNSSLRDVLSTYKPSYTAPAPAHSNGIPVDFSEHLGAQLNLNDLKLLVMAAVECHFLEAEYDEYAVANASGVGCFHSAALIFMALLLLRHALAITSAGGEEDVSTFFTLFLLRAAGFLLPCYIIAGAMNILQRRRQSRLFYLSQEAATTAAKVAFLLQAGRARGLRFAAAAATASASGSSHGH